MLWSDIADLVLSRACIACERIGPVVCVACWERAVDVRRHQVPMPGLPPVIVGTGYDGLGRDAVHALKERGVLAMADAVGSWLAISIAEAASRGIPHALVPVPAHRRSLAARGVDTLDRIARRAVTLLREGGHAVQVVPALERTLDRGRQVGMGAHDRRIAVSATMRVRDRAAQQLAGHRLIVIDDVVTTGATIGEAARALRTAGLEVHAAAAACGTPRSGQSREPGLHALHHGIDA